MDNSSQSPCSEAAASDKNGGPPAKNYVCKHGGCGKRFTRLEHLNRHALNHKPGDATCSRCRAHFKRPDLLARHMERHKKRDEESGGNGTLNTRKRLWKRDDGAVVQKRPTTQQPSAESTGDPAAEQRLNPSLTAHAEGPISPPISHQSADVPSSVPSQESYQHLDFGLPKDASSALPDLSFESTNFQFTANFGDDFCGQSSFQPVYQGTQAFTDIPYDEVFQPDTASSFNMPYTTATNYNWLFDLNNNLDMDDHDMGHQEQQQQQQQQPQQPQPQQRRQMVTLDSRIPCTSAHPAPSPSQSTHSSQQISAGSYGTGVFSCPQDTVGVGTSSPVSSRRTEPPPGANTAAINFPGCIEPERPLATLHPTTSLPCIDECTRGELLDLIESLRPISPADEPVTRDNKLLSLSSLQAYLDLFFTRFNTAYPLIHQATFVASSTETIYLLAMLLLGATYSGKGAHQLAVCIHDVMRPGIFAHAAFSAEPELWVLKTILLVECFGKSRAGQKQHNMSHLFHGLLINLIRRSDCQTVQPVGPNEANDDDLEVAWLRWAEAEEKKRLALLCFLWDTQHAVLFCQSLCMSSFELRLSLPSSQTLWEARTASEWKSHGATYAPEPQFLTTLKSFLVPSAARPPRLNCLSRVLVLHGLMSIYWDMQRRDQTSLGVIPGQNNDGTGTWRDRIARAYDLWKADFDAYCAALSAAHYEGGPGEGCVDAATRDARREFAVFTTSYNAVYHAAQVLLNADFLDLQIYAGARHILGRPVQRGDFVRSERVVKQWAASSVDNNASSSSADGGGGGGQHRSVSSAKAAWHAASLLVDASRNLDNFDALGLFHVPWCLYLATLTCWAFHHAGKRGDEAGGASSSEIVWDARGEMNALVNSMAASGNPWELGVRQGRERTGGLVWVMANALERVRWGIVHSGVMVLRGLVPWRLINQYEAC